MYGSYFILPSSRGRYLAPANERTASISSALIGSISDARTATTAIDSPTPLNTSSRAPSSPPPGMAYVVDEDPDIALPQPVLSEVAGERHTLVERNLHHGFSLRVSRSKRS